MLQAKTSPTSYGFFVMEILEAAITSPWVYLAIFVVVAVDAFLPAVPSEIW